MRIAIYALKFFVEFATIMAWLSAGAAVLWGNVAGDNVDAQSMAQVYGDMFGLALGVIGLAFFLMWWALVRFGHVPWWL